MADIQLHKVNKAFAHKIIFANLSYTFRKKVYHITGKNGSGKSTLLRLIAGVDTPDSGSIILNNHCSVTDHSLNAKKLFYVPDDMAVYPFLTGEAFLSWLSRARKPNHPNEMNQLFEQFELQPHLHTRISDMSFGTKKKFLLSSALIGQPDFIVLDEPLNGLDKTSQQTLLILLQKKAVHCGILFTSHHNAYPGLLNSEKVEVSGHHLIDKLCEPQPG